MSKTGVAIKKTLPGKSVDRQRLLAQLEAVEPGLAQREMAGQEHCFVFDGGRVKSFNDEIACSGRCSLPKEFRGAVRGKPLLEHLRKLRDDELGVTVEDGRLRFHGRGRSFMNVETEILLPLDLVDIPAKDGWKPLPAGFCEAVNVVRSCAKRTAAGDESFLVCVHVHPDWVEASDRFQACRWPLATGFVEPVLIRQDALKHVATLGMTHFGQSDNWAHFRNDNGLVLSCRRYIEEFPDLGKFLKGKGVRAKLPAGLPEAAEIASQFSKENPDADYLRVELRKRRVTVSGIGSTGGYSETKRVEYDGDRLEFMISPQILVEVVRKHDTVEIVSDEHGNHRMKAAGGSFSYVTALVPSENADSAEVPEE